MVKFNINKIYDDIDLSYKFIYNKKLTVDNINLNYHIFSIFDFYKFLLDKKNIYLKIKEFIKRFDSLDIFYYLFIKYIEFNNNIHIILITTDDNNNDFIGFITVFYDIYKKFSFGEHFLVNPDFRNLGIGTKLLYYYLKFFFKHYKLPFYGIILKNNIPSIKVVEKLGCVLYDDTHETKKIYYITNKIFKSNKNLKNII